MFRSTLLTLLRPSGLRCSSSVFVGNLAWGLKSVDLEEAFARFGPIQSATIVNDRDTARGPLLTWHTASLDRSCRLLGRACPPGRHVPHHVAHAIKTQAYSGGQHLFGA